MWASGEIWEYLERAGGREGSKYGGEPEVGKFESIEVVFARNGLSTYQKVRHWHARMVDYLIKWVEEHKDGGPDTWTPAPGESKDET